MFWGRKIMERITELETKSGALGARMEAFEQLLRDGNSRLDDASSRLGQLQRGVREQGMSIEDLLEEWGERNAAADNLSAQLRERDEERKLLFELFEAYQDQLRNLRRFAEGKDDAWAAQIAMMEDGLERYRRSCGICLTGERGETVDYDLHEVVEVVDTDQPESDRKIADVYSNGYLYRGVVQKKARVVAYAFRGHPAEE